jgi:alpha,alpha-trehalose phosphorylase
MLLRPDAFEDPEQVARNFAYYEQLTVRDSSLSAAVQAAMAARTGHLDLAYDYLGETALIDLDDLAGNSGEGVHLASLAGSWTAIVAGFGGMRAGRDGSLAFAPQLPSMLARVAFGLHWRGVALRVEITPAEAEYRLLSDGQALLTHHGEEIELSGTEPQRRPIPPLPPREPPEQPLGRAPVPRRPST